jgi:uncharacterized protein
MCAAGNFEACVEHGSELHLKSSPSGDYVAVPEGPEHVKALKLFEKACAGGNGRGCNMAGAMLQHGAGVAKNPERSVAFYQRGCDLKDAVACYNYGFVLVLGEEVPRQPERALPALKFSCENPYPAACGALALLYERGVSGPVDAAAARKYRSLALPLLREACDKDKSECFTYAATALSVNADDEAARSMLRSDCEQGDASSCLRLADVVKEPVALLERACRLGGLCFPLAELYRTGKSVRSDQQRALALYAKACENGQSEACAFAGPASEARKGVKFIRLRCQSLKEPTACAVLNAYEQRLRKLDETP